MRKKTRKTKARIATAAGMALAAGVANATVCVDGCEGIGDFVWNDQNMNGIQDNNETGIGGVTVNLLRDSNNAQIDSVVTLADGSYLFVISTMNLGYTDFKIEFELLAGYSFSNANVGVDETIDSDADPFTGLTGTISLPGYPGPINLDVDAGMNSKVVPVPAAAWLFGSGLLGLIGIARRKTT